MILVILPDSKRPDRLWCFDEKGTFAVLNAITGKLEVPWKPITNMETSGVLLYDCSMERIVLGRMDDKISWIITGYGRNPSGLDGIFEFNLKSDLKCYDNLRNFAIHPDRTDLLALILDTSVLIVKVSQDNWNPETILLQDCRCDAIQWGPEENDPINGERGCKIVLVDKESKQMKLFTLSSI
jgi:hypothetical protein